MPRNGHATTKKKSQPAEHYDNLNQTDQDTWDEIGKMGFRVKPTFSAHGFKYEAFKAGAKELAGPVDSLDRLLTEVRRIDALGNSGYRASDDDQDEPAGRETAMEPAAQNISGEKGYLFDEMKPRRQADVPELNAAIMAYESYKYERIDLLAKEVEAKKTVEGLMRANRDQLAYDPNTKVRSYRCNDYIEELLPGEEKFNSRKATDADDE